MRKHAFIGKSMESSKKNPKINPKRRFGLEFRLNEITRPDQNINQINSVSRINPDSGINPVS